MTSADRPSPSRAQHEGPRVHFDQLYAEVSRSLANANEQLDALKVDHEEGRRTLGGIRERLAGIRSSFDAELSLLQDHAEWDRFTVAFFGETNAGKSTVLESLRILFGEDGRQALLAADEGDVERHEEVLRTQADEVRRAIHDAIQAHAARLLEVEHATAGLRAIVEAESSARARRRQWLSGIAGLLLGAVLTFVSMHWLAGR